MMNFAQFLEMKFLEWQQKEGGRKTVADFAEYIGVAQTTASSYMNGKRKPDGENLRRIANVLGFQTYDLLGIPRPDEDLAYINQHWDEVSEDFRRKFREEVEKQLADEQSKGVRKNRRAHANS